MELSSTLHPLHTALTASLRNKCGSHGVECKSTNFFFFLSVWQTLALEEGLINMSLLNVVFELYHQTIITLLGGMRVL